MRNPQRILFTSIGLGSGGVRDSYTYNFVTKEMEALVDKGAEVYFFHERFNHPEIINGVRCLGGKWFSNVSRARVAAIILKSLPTLFSPLFIDVRRTYWGVKINIAIADLVKELDIDLIHTHFFYPLGLNCAMTKKIVDVPVLSTLRGAELHNRPDLDYGARRDPLYRRLFEFGLKSANYITAPNPELVRDLINQHEASEDRVSMVPNGFENISVDRSDIDFFQPEALNLLSIGNCIALKNHKLVIETVKSLLSKRDIDIRLIIVGKGPLTDELQKAAEGVPIKIVPEMKKSVLASYMKQADALVHASLLEGMPNVVLEALSLGTPCIVSDISAHRMLIQEEVNGYIFDPYGIDSLARVISDAYDNRDSLKSMSEDCIKFSKKYSLDAKIGRYLEIYRMLLSESKNKDIADG